MRRWWGTAVGFAVGVLGGAYGALFGLFIGLLVDLVSAEIRAHRATVRFLETGVAAKELPRAVALAGALLGELRPHRRELANAELESLALRLRSFFPDRFARRLIERVIAAAAAHEWIGDERFTRLALDATTIEERRHLTVAVWEVLRERGYAPAAQADMHRLASRLGLGDGFIARAFAVGALLDAEACTVLGVSRRASQSEIRAAYRKLAAQFHPDTSAWLSEEQRLASEHAFKRINAAYEKLRED
jgi:DnaJ-domain-containing protein 1